MKTLPVAVLLLASGVAVADNTDLKAGLWEMKLVHQVMDGRDMTAQMAASQSHMQEMLANMPAAQKAQMERMLGGQNMPPQAGPGGTFRVCISPGMAARNTPALDPEGRCQPHNLARSGDTTRFEFRCVQPGGQVATGKGEVRVNGDRADSRMDMNMTDAKGHHTMQTESQMRYLGTDCQGVKPADQLARESKAPGR